MTSSDAAENPEEGRIDAAPSDDSSGALPHLAATPADAGDEAPVKPVVWFLDNRWGLAGSLALHGLALYLLFFAFHTALPPAVFTILPVEIVIGDDTTAPQQARQAAAPQQRSAAPQPPAPRPVQPTLQPVQQLASLPPPAVVPLPTPTPEPPRDALQEKLEALANMRAPENGNARVNASGNGTRPGPEAYSVRDYVRAQVERRWTPNTTGLRNRNIAVAIHVVLERDGTVMLAEIVDQKRFETDASYYLLALSARNAVLLSSPIALPAGSGAEDLDMVLNLNPATLVR